MTGSTLKRRLWYFEGLKPVTVGQDFLTSDLRSLVVLGEAGMGKSTLLEQFEGSEGYSVCTARKLLIISDPASLLGNAKTLVIDALDEVSVRGEGEAVDLVLAKLSALGCPRFIMSCRVADWRSATALQGISDFYGDTILELHLDPLKRDEAIDFLSVSLGGDGAAATIDHLEKRGLSGLWGNPQTLELIERVAKAGKLPQSRGELFEEATKLLCAEHREAKVASKLVTLPEREVLDASGAGFASLILTGKDALSRRAQADPEDTAISEVSALPKADRLPEVLDSRLFAARAPERFTYTHRAIGEFLGARWLARVADTSRKRRRLLGLFNSQPVVPASIRGIHAWLAWHSSDLAGEVIAADPMAVIEYGDADNLSPSQGEALLAALLTLSQEKPNFRDWADYRASGLIQPSLLPVLRATLVGTHFEFGLRMLILQALQGATHAPEFVADLRSLMFDTAEAFAIRYEAALRLVELSAGDDWNTWLRTLADQGTEDSARLAIELMGKIGFDNFSDRLVLDLISAQLDRSERTIGVFYKLERDFPAERLDALLDGIASMAPSGPHGQAARAALFELTCSLLSRRLAGSSPNVARFWSWLRPFDDHHGYGRESRRSVAEALAANDDLRRGVQRLVLLADDLDQTIWYRAWRLADMSVGLAPNESDVCALLDGLEIGDTRWREVLTIARHDADSGGHARASASRLAVSDEDKAWLAGLEHPPKPDWQVEQEKEHKKRAAKRLADWTRHRADFKIHINALRDGIFGSVLGPAKAYLKLFYDMGDECYDGPARVEEWLGAEIRDAALHGFEAFLSREPPHPTATDIAKSYAESRHWEAGYIIVAALAERLRTGRGLDDLPDERLMAGNIETRHSRIAEHAGLSGLESALADALIKRGKWEEAQRLFFEPQLEARLQYVDGLYEFLHASDHAELADKLATEWLKRFPEMSGQAEAHLIDRLLSSVNGCASLLEILPGRIIMSLDDERRLNWDAVGLIVNFSETSARLDAASAIEPALLWQFRERLGGRRNDQKKSQLKVAQLVWAIRSFRPLYKYVPIPIGSSTGDRNAWDASDFLIGLVNQLGEITSPEATDALSALREAKSDGYTRSLRVAAADQKRKRVEAEWQAPDLDTVAAAVADSAPTTSEQLQAVMLEELVTVQAKVRGDPLDWYKDFFDADGPRREEDCRDTIMKMFGELPFGIYAAPEGHLGDDKRCDIICTIGNLMVPIEVKGQWHNDLWTSADEQLDRLYVNDWRAERGIYLILWFGQSPVKPLRRPPKGINLPATAEDLRRALGDQSVAARDKRTEIVVLDLTRPT